jgi:hypothetical protein
MKFLSELFLKPDKWMGRRKVVNVKKRFKAYSCANERGSIMMNEYGRLQKWISFLSENDKSTVNVHDRSVDIIFSINI